jgi:hypothetical protein
LGKGEPCLASEPHLIGGLLFANISICDHLGQEATLAQQGADGTWARGDLVKRTMHTNIPRGRKTSTSNWGQLLKAGTIVIHRYSCNLQKGENKRNAKQCVKDTKRNVSNHRGENLECHLCPEPLQFPRILCVDQAVAVNVSVGGKAATEE